MLTTLFALALGQESPETVAEAEPDGVTAEDVAPAEPTGPTTVKVGVHINDIMAIDLRSHSFMADGYIWFRWSGDKDPASSMEFINPFELWGHMEEVNFEEPQELDDGSLYQVMRFQGGFSQKLPLYDYPLDQQVLGIVFEDSVDPVQGVIYESDGITINPMLTLPGFEIGKPALVIEAHRYETQFGDPRQSEPETYSRARIEVPIARPILAYAVKLLLPILCAAVSGVLMFMFRPSLVDTRTGIGITSLLTIVALQITSNEDLPEIGYLTLLDKLYVCAYLLVISGLLAVVRSTMLTEDGKEDAARRFDRRALLGLTLSFAAAAGYLINQAAR